MIATKAGISIYSPVVYRRAARNVLAKQNPAFYETINEACHELGVDYSHVRGPAVDLMMGTAFGTPTEICLAYLLLADIIEADDA